MKTPSHVVPSYPSITQLIETLSLQAKGKRTREEYLRYVRKLAQHSGGAIPLCSMKLPLD